ncbi:MAG: hypothetical protein ACFHX7_07810 [Pseudomonadota bacterium]
MRDLTEEEIEEVSGGNPVAGAALSIAGAYYAGEAIGDSINDFNLQVSGMSLGEAIYRTEMDS